MGINVTFIIDGVGARIVNNSEMERSVIIEFYLKKKGEKTVTFSDL